MTSVKAEIIYKRMTYEVTWVSAFFSEQVKRVLTLALGFLQTQRQTQDLAVLAPFNSRELKSK